MSSHEESPEPFTNPYTPPSDMGENQGSSSGIQTRIVILDTVTEANYRNFANLSRIKLIGLSVSLVALGAIIGGIIWCWSTSGEMLIGVLVGGYTGLMAGLLGNPIYLMTCVIYSIFIRMVNHLRGKPD